jgi:2-polyprenyl-3-methyl-5-hydroxy-6-metoxy-1,4-benzoquinol methylase
MDQDKIKVYEKTFTNIYDNNLWHMGQDDSKSGVGSSNPWTIHIKDIITNVVGKFNIKSMIDTSCGDLNWMKLLFHVFADKNVKYLGIDIVEKLIKINKSKYETDSIKFLNIDFLSYLKSQPDKSVDLILCRHTCEHLETQYVSEFINEAKRVSRFLLLTTHKNALANREVELTSTPYRPINLNLSPYSDMLDTFQIDSFYDGPQHTYLSEMFINFYDFGK